ncbi:flagellar type III secretion system protein FlhB (plasmid) [Sphingomonas paeninsulae]|uniref:Flagellar type III secretion system protein FlhB n=1 Tax=Sphingomonas paeninsulae TaxID=2319844 RepID=A0A494T8I7_SPHPE|nr:EscU/YscU/HrcU family type III secretion system export apparatus switch protein [Sphingomonas paeninsulae]AYJ85240.1 flagellar type III secretion system protein FlhB [Sphingomonas paeninsulae]
MSNDSGERTEAATPKRLREAKKDGDLPDIRDLSTAAIAIAGAGWIAFSGRAVWSGAKQALVVGLAGNLDPQLGFDPVTAVVPLLEAVAMPLAALFAATWVAVFASRAIGGGLGTNWHAVAPKMARVSPIQGLQRLFSSRGLIDFAKSLAKLIFLGSAAAWVFSSSSNAIMALSAADVGSSIEAAALILGRIAVGMAIALVAIAAIDAPIQIGLRNARLRMSKQQVRDEHRESEHSPEIRQQIHAKRAALMDQSARKAIKEATVILVNPTSFAVALRYRPGEDAAPIVVARARAEAAAALRELARNEDVPILSYPVLTRALYFTSRSGQVIDEKLYRSVATVLAFVFGLGAAMDASRIPPEIDVPDDLRYSADGMRST